jgi:uncharacterized membrane protein YbhN (UPF0104 family)
MKNKTIEAVKFVFGWPIAIIALFFIAKIIFPSLSKISQPMQTLNVSELILSFVIFILYFYSRAVLWQKLLEYKGKKFSLKDTAFLWGLSEIKRFVPGNIWALVGRTAAFSDEELKKGTVFSAIILEVECVALGSMFLSLLALPLITNLFFKSFFSESIITTLAIGISILVCIVFIFSKAISQLFPHFLHNFLPTHKIAQNTVLIILACLSLLLFGLGTYYSIDALFSLHSASLLTMIGLFSFSFFAGYASIVTPMGLGIREGVITAGLTPVISLPLAGLAAIFTRIVIILAEVFFLGLAFIIRKFI